MRRDVIAPAGDRDQPDRPRRNRRRALAMGICARTGGGDRAPLRRAPARAAGIMERARASSASSRRACCAAPASRPTMRAFSPGGIGDAPTPASLMSSLRPHSAPPTALIWWAAWRRPPRWRANGFFPAARPIPTISARRECLIWRAAHAAAFEETGLDIGTLKAEPGWTLVRDGGYLGLMKRLTAGESANVLRARIVHYLASETQPENFRDPHCAEPCGSGCGHAAFSDGVS